METERATESRDISNRNTRVGRNMSRSAGKNKLVAPREPRDETPR